MKDLSERLIEVFLVNFESYVEIVRAVLLLGGAHAGLMRFVVKEGCLLGGGAVVEMLCRVSLLGAKGGGC